MIAAGKRFRIQRIPIYQKQAEFRQSTAWLRGFCAGRGSGKTKIGALDILLRAKNGEPFLAVSPTYPMLQESALPAFEETARDMGVLLHYVKSPTPRIKFATQDGGKAHISFRSAENPDGLRGGNFAGAWFDEGSVICREAFDLGIATLRVRSDLNDDDRNFCIITFTPKGRRHWTYEVFFDSEGEPKPGTHLVTAHTSENYFISEDFYTRTASQYTAALAAQELAGEFVDLQGLMFAREDFEQVDRVPVIADRVRYWDKAATEGAGCRTCGLLMARTPDGLFWVEDVKLGQWSAMERDKIMLQTAEEDAKKYNNSVIIVVEQEGGSGGKESMENTIRLLAGYPVFRDIPSGKGHRIKDKQRLPGEAKIVRAQPLAAQVEAGNVRVKRADWLGDFLEEITAFPEYAFADQVDAASGAFNRLAITDVRHGYGGAAQSVEVNSSSDSRFGVQLDRTRKRALFGR